MADLASASDAIASIDIVSQLSDIRFLLSLILAWITVFAIFTLARCVCRIIGQNITHYL